MASEAFNCSLCLQFSSEENDWFVSTPCGHVFHNSCIRPMIDAGDTIRISCPMCRKPVTSSSLTRLYGINPDTTTAVLNTEIPDHTFKLVLIGETSVGKSCLLQRYSTGVFQPNTISTIGCDISFKTVEIAGKIVKLKIWDTGGQERFRSIAYNFIRDVHGVMLVYDVTTPASFEAIPYWLQYVKDAGLPDVVKLLVGNKTDLQPRMITTEQGRRFATKEKLSFFETSALECYNVEAAFRCLVGEVLANREDRRDHTSGNGNTTPTISLSTSQLSSTGSSNEKSCGC